MEEIVDFSELHGITLAKIEKGDDELTFITEIGERYRLAHDQDCCESVTIDDICGNLDDLIGSPILLAEEVKHEGENPDGIVPPEDYQDSFTWTFYKLATVKGYVTIRWYGSSDGYYSETATLYKVTKGR